MKIRAAVTHSPINYAFHDQQITISRHTALKVMAELGYTSPLPAVGRERPVVRNVSVQGRPSLFLFHRTSNTFYLYAPGVEVRRWADVFDVKVLPPVSGRIPTPAPIAMLHHG